MCVRVPVSLSLYGRVGVSSEETCQGFSTAYVERSDINADAAKTSTNTTNVSFIHYTTFFVIQVPKPSRQVSFRHHRNQESALIRRESCVYLCSCICHKKRDYSLQSTFVSWRGSDHAGLVFSHNVETSLHCDFG